MVVVATGQGLSEFMILNAAVASAILLVGSIRNRRKLIYVGIAVGIGGVADDAGRRDAGGAAVRPRSGPMPCALACGAYLPGC